MCRFCSQFSLSVIDSTKMNGVQKVQVLTIAFKQKMNKKKETRVLFRFDCGVLNSPTLMYRIHMYRLN